MSTNDTPATATPAPAAAPARPSAHRSAFIVWLAVYPTITIALALLTPLVGELPLLLRTLILTAIVVPIAAYALIPLLHRLNASAVRATQRRRLATR
ncbi:hypothetical protein [Embleya sp. AB8]|uniref:hypothetical protein n=1 Tax=Embleya sp. AB8 TaxID=3156304 RepID=UPI003C7565F9